MARDHAETLRKLLRLAEGVGNQAEKDRAFAKALAFAEKHQIDANMLEAESSGNPVVDRRTAWKKPFAIEKRRLWSVISNNFGCRSVILAGNVTHTYGFSSDIEMSLVMFKLLWDHGCKELEEAIIPDNVSAKSFSTAFWAAYQVKIKEKLALARSETVANTTGAELVLVRRSDDVTSELNKAYPHLRKAAKRYLRSAAGWAAGNAAGERAKFGPEIA